MTVVKRTVVKYASVCSTRKVEGQLANLDSVGNGC